MKNCSFQICCPSCETHFEVNDPQLIGQIVACPKCAGMILIEAPNEQSDNSALDLNERPRVVSSEGHASGDISDFGQVSLGEDNSPIAQSASKNLPEAPPVLATEMEEPIEREERPENVPSKTETSFRSSRSRFRFLILVGVFSGMLTAGIVLWGILALKQEKQVPQSETHVETASEKGADLPANSHNDEQGDFSESRSSEALSVEASDVETNDDSNDISVDLEMSDNSLWNEQSLITEDASLQDPPVEEESALLSKDDEVEEPSIDEQSSTTTTSSNEDLLTEADEELFVEFDEERFTKENTQEEESVEEEDAEFYPAPEEFDTSLNVPKLNVVLEPLDIEARLQLPIISIVFPKSPLASLRLLSEYSGAPVSLDLNAIILLRNSWNKSLDLKLEETTVFDALVKEAEMLHWRASKEDGYVLIEPELENDYGEQRFDFSELLDDSSLSLVNIQGSDAPTENIEKLTIERLEEFIRTLVVCEKDEAIEGQSFDVAHEGASLIIRGSLIERKQVEILYEQLRVLNGLATSEGFLPEELVPENRGWRFLSKKTPFNIPKPIALQQAVEILESQFKFLAIWDDVTLNASGVGRFSSVRASFEEQSVDQILTNLLEPLKLTYLILDEQAVMITTKEKGNEYRTTEIHGFTESDSPLTFEEAVKFSEKMMKSVQAGSWETENSALWLEVNSGTWFVKQTQPIHREIRRWTADSLERKNAEVK
ncbi:MAG: hypothetical protein ACI4NP_04665 [Thermoguttaceae bacterium]